MVNLNHSDFITFRQDNKTVVQLFYHHLSGHEHRQEPVTDGSEVLVLLVIYKYLLIEGCYFRFKFI